MKKIYCISGLGADERIFRNLSIPGVQLVHLGWAPFDIHDEIPCYAQKMSALIRDDAPTIIGLSFGGMVAVEIAKLRNVEKVFIISSAKTKNELVQGTGTFLSFLIKNNIIPAGLFTMPNNFLLKRFGATTKEEKQLLTSILDTTDPHFVKWAMKALLEWRNETYPENIIHIHGTADRIIMPDNIHPNAWVEGGSHMMVYNRAGEISKLIAENL